MESESNEQWNAYRQDAVDEELGIYRPAKPNSVQ